MRTRRSRTRTVKLLTSYQEIPIVEHYFKEPVSPTFNSKHGMVLIMLLDETWEAILTPWDWALTIMPILQLEYWTSLEVVSKAILVLIFHLHDSIGGRFATPSFPFTPILIAFTKTGETKLLFQNAALKNIGLFCFSESLTVQLHQKRQRVYRRRRFRLRSTHTFLHYSEIYIYYKLVLINYL